MPRDYLMTWEHKRCRWAKMYKGKRYTVTPSVLSVRFGTPVPETQDGSYQFANRWWREKQAELDAARQPTPPRPLSPLEDILAILFAGHQRAFDDPSVVVSAALGDEQFDPPPGEELYFVDPVTKTIEDGVPQSARREALRAVFRRLEKHLLDGEPLPETLAQKVPPPRLQQVKDSIAGLRGEMVVPAERTVKACVDQLMKSKQIRVDADKLSPDRCEFLHRQLKVFLDWVGPETDVKTIDARTLQGFEDFCNGKIAEREQGRGKGWSGRYAQDTYAAMKYLINYLVEMDVITPPKNLKKRVSFNAGTPEPEPWTAEEFRLALDLAPDHMKIVLLLCINCGMTSQDISDLRRSEVDWDQGRIVRHRSKARRYTNRRKVSYLLWPETLRLLRAQDSGSELVLLTRTGKPLVRKERKDGKYVKSDIIGSNYKLLREKLQNARPGFKRQLKGLRKTGATMIRDIADSEVSDLYLAHAAKDVGGKFYRKSPQERLDEALTEMGKQLGLTDAADLKAGNPLPD
jgi:integrase